MTFHFYFAFFYIYIVSGTARFITVETRMVPDYAGIAPTPSRWRHGCSRRLPGLSRYLTAFPVMPRSYIHGSPRRFHYGLNLTDDPGNANFRSLIRMQSVVATGLDYGCNTESYGPVQIATNDTGSYPWLIRLSLREYVTWALLPVSPGCFKHFKTTGDMSRFNWVQHVSFRISKVVHGAATVVTRFINNICVTLCILLLMLLYYAT